MKVVSGLCLFVVALAYTSAQQQLPPAPADGSCEPGKSYKVDCNTCVCAPNGKLGACTLAGCLPPRSKRQAHDALPPVPADGSCTPGQAYKDDCNTCRCGNDGKIGACTLAACPPRSKRDAEPAECAPNDVIKRDCNTCYCESGRWACTRKECVDLTKLPRDRRASPLPPLPADGTCTPGNSYQKDCNVCRCLPNGAVACTEKACISKRSADPQECSDGQTKQEDCNNCHCANGLWACTRRFCNRKRRETCATGETKQQDCNTCTCANGEWACTRKFCAGQNRKRRETCVTGETKQQDCNTCTCAKGEWACTKKFCVGESRQRRETCADGDTKQEDCNTCRCTKGAWACTRKICPGQNRKRREACTDGETKKENCNNCQCVNGNWACTVKDCKTGVFRKRRDADECAVGAYKKEDCNTCNCIKLGDGSTGWACTKLACPHPDPPRTRRDV